MAKRNKQRDLQNLPAVAADFLREAVEKMRYRKSVRQDVCSELVAYFEYELKDCPTDQEKEQKAQRLIDDSKLLDIFLRGAKKCCRPLWRTVLIRSLVAFGLLLVCLVLYIVWFTTGKPTISVDYTALLNLMNRPEIIDEDNAWPHYEKAVSLYVEPNDGLAEALTQFYWDQTEYIRLRDFPSSNRPELIKWVQLNEAAWAEFTAGSSKPYCYREHTFDSNCEEEWLFNIPLPHTITFRDIARLGLWHSLIAASRGQNRQALDDCLAIVRSGAHWHAKSTLIEQLAGLALTNLACRQIANILDAHEPPAAMLEEFHRQLEQILPDDHPLINMEGERLAFLDTVQRIFTQGGPGGGHMIPNRWHQLNYVVGLEDREIGILDFSGYALSSMVHARRDLTIEKANDIFDHEHQLAKMTPFERRVGNIESVLDVIFSLPYRKFLLFHLVLPAFDKVVEIGCKNKAMHRATLTILALERWRLEKGAYPATLVQLTEQGYLTELPMDPYSDKTLVYKSTDGSFTLYSLSHNFEDDAGEPGREHYIFDEVFRSEPNGPDDKDKGRMRHWLDEGDTVFWPIP